MAYEPPRMPERDEILKRALEIYHAANPHISTNPEEDELREGSYWTRARDELMTGIRAALEQYLSYLESEADRAREELGVEKPLPTDERLTELENQLARIEERYRATRARLQEAEEELRKIYEAKPPPAPPAPPPTPPPAPTGITNEEVELLWQEFVVGLNLAKVASPESYRDRFNDAINRKETYMENATRLYRLTERIIREARAAVPTPVPVPVPVTAMPVRVAIREARVREYRTEICLVCRVQHTIDVDLIRRVSEGSDEFRGAGRVRHVPPVLGFPYSFYHMCPDCRFAQFGYRDIYDALAYLLAEGRRSEYKKVKVTKDTLRAIGLDEADLSEIQSIEERYRTTS
jgi:hypothetical protein